MGFPVFAWRKEGMSPHFYFWLSFKLWFSEPCLISSPSKPCQGPGSQGVFVPRFSWMAGVSRGVLAASELDAAAGSDLLGNHFRPFGIGKSREKLKIDFRH